MSARSADTARERRRAVKALLTAATTTMPSPWSSTHKAQSFAFNGVSNHDQDYDCVYRSACHHGHVAAADTDGGTDGGTDGSIDGDKTTLDGDDDLVGAIDSHLLGSGGAAGAGAEDGLDLCSSTWKSVETMARALAVGQSVVSTISRCYSLPALGSTSGQRGVTSAARRSAQEAGAETIYSSLLSGRFTAKALAEFRRLGQAPRAHPDGVYIDLSKLPEAAKALDPALDDATIRAWLKANGFEQQNARKHSSIHEALSWTEYHQALSDLSPALRRSGAGTKNSGKSPTANTMPAAKSRSAGDSRLRASACSSSGSLSLSNLRYRAPWESVPDRTAGSPPRQPRSGLENEDHHLGGKERGCPPRSPGADSYGLLRRKRHAAVSVDYEAITNKLPQVMPPLDPSILVDHIKAQGRLERKKRGGEGGGSSQWALDPHERLLKMSLQKEQVSETANPRLVQPRHAAVQLRSRRSEFGRRKEAEIGLMARLARNAGVICRQANIAEAKKLKERRHSADQSRVENQRAAEATRSLLVRVRAKNRASERRRKMEMLKSCIADQLRTIQEKEDRALVRVRNGRHVLRKGEGIDKTVRMQRLRSSAALQPSNMVGTIREPWLMPTVPPPEDDARWVLSEETSPVQGKPASPAAETKGPSVTLSSLALGESRSDTAASATGVDRPAFPRQRGRTGRNGGTEKGTGEGEEKGRADGTGGDACTNTTSAAASPPSPAGQSTFGALASKRHSLVTASRAGEQNMRLCSSTGVVQGRTRDRFLQKPVLPRRKEGSGGVYCLSPSNRAGRVWCNRNGAPQPPLSPGSSCVSPWCRQVVSPTDLGGPIEGLCSGQDQFIG